MNSLKNSSIKKRISLIVPFYNEGDNIVKIYNEIKDAINSCKDKYDFEILFVDNHSTDNSFAVAQSLSQANPPDHKVKILRFSRNFGYQASIMTGYLNCTGDAAIEIDCDGEDDPHLVLSFLEKWEQGYQVVYGIRKFRNEPHYIQLQRRFFYRLVKVLSDIPLPVDAGDFRLLDRKVIEHLKNFSENTLYVRGLVSYIGFSQIGIPYDRRPRYDGKSKFSYWATIRFAWHAIAAFSRAPLIVTAYIGFFTGIGSFIYLVILINQAFKWTGFELQVIVMILIVTTLLSILLIGMGILGAYIGRIFDEVKHRPRAIIETHVGFDS